MIDPRSIDLDKVRKDGAFDVIVVGGGINGIGMYRDLTLQGLRVLLVERFDFSSGCSSALSRMVHGGLRYLENGEFDLVKESLAERDALLSNAPHMVFPLPTVIPVISIFSGLLNSAMHFFGFKGRPRQRGLIPIFLGLSFYDFLTRNRRLLPRFNLFDRSSALSIWPQLRSDLKFAAVYHDAWISHPERLAIELILESESQSNNSVSLNYAEIQFSGNEYNIKDKETGRLYAVSAKVIVNSTGAWLDETAKSLGSIPSKELVSGTKGSHLIIENKDLFKALNNHMVYFENLDGRVCIVFPYLGKVLAGATDIRVTEATRVRCEDEERDYILGSLGLIFPKISLSISDIVFSFSGIRPLPNEDVDFTGRITREHFTVRIEGPVPQFCMIGGKWTTFRSFSEQTTNMVLDELKITRRISTHGLSIGGGRDFQPSLNDRFADLYGTRAPEYRSDLTPVADLDITVGEIRSMIASEKARKISDILQRRQPLAITGKLTRYNICETAKIMASFLNWSEDRIRFEVSEFTSDLIDFHGYNPELLKE